MLLGLCLWLLAGLAVALLLGAMAERDGGWSLSESGDLGSLTWQCPKCSLRPWNHYEFCPDCGAPRPGPVVKPPTDTPLAEPVLPGVNEFGAQPQ